MQTTKAVLVSGKLRGGVSNTGRRAWRRVGGRVGAAESWHPAGPQGGRGAADSTWILPAAYLLARPRSAQDGRRMPAGSGKSATPE